MVLRSIVAGRRDINAQTPISWVGRTIREIDSRRRYNVNVLGVHRGDEMLMSLTADTKILKGDDLLVLGHRGDVELIEYFD